MALIWTDAMQQAALEGFTPRADEGIDPDEIVGSRAAELEREWGRRKKKELVIQYAQPLLQSLAAAVGQPGYRRNRAFWSTLLGEGGQFALGEVMRPRVLRQAALDQALKEATVKAQVMRATRPTYWETRTIEAVDSRTGKKVFTTPQDIRRNPGVFVPPDKETGSSNWNFHTTTEESPEGTVLRGWWTNPRTREVMPATLSSAATQSSEAQPSTQGPAAERRPISGPGLGRALAPAEAPRISPPGQFQVRTKLPKEEEAPKLERVVDKNREYVFIDNNRKSATFGQVVKRTGVFQPHEPRGRTGDEKRQREQLMIEETAGDYLEEADGDPNAALKRFEADLQSPEASAELKRFAAKIRQRIRERVRPGKPPGKRDRLKEILGGSAEQRRLGPGL